MSDDAVRPGAAPPRDPPPEGARLTKPRNLVVAVVLLIALALVARWSVSMRPDGEPWCVWATPTGTMLTWVTPPVPEFGDVRDATGGPIAGRDWTTCCISRSVDGKPGASIPGLGLARNPILEWLGLARGFTSWESTRVERTLPDGRTATAFVRSSSAKGLGRPSPDASVAGEWELRDANGVVRRLVLVRDGAVEGDAKALWGVRDGALVIDRGEVTGGHVVETFVLSADRRSLDGSALDSVHGKKVE